MDELKYSTTELGKCSKEYDRIVNSGKPLKAQLAQIKKLLAEMNFNGLQGSEEFTRIAQSAGQMQDAISDASQAVNKFSSDTMNLDAGIQAIQGITAAGTVATGVMGLFGVENENVAKAILKVQSALSILNGVQAIANVLNKDSALMLKLKSTGLFGNTAATVANTTATAANSATEGINATATAANTATKTANTAATTANTTAQLANNAAVLANPYVAAAAAVAALTAGIIYWTKSNNDAKESQEAVNLAIEAFREEMDKQSDKLAEQITTFNRLKKTYDESGGKVDILTKKIINNKDAQQKLGVVLKTVDDVHKLFGRNSTNYVNAAIARANAMAAEAAQAALLGQSLSALSKIYAKLLKGEEVDYKDFVSALEKVGIKSTKAFDIMQKAGGSYEQDIVFGNLKVDPDKIGEFMTEINKLVTQEFYNSGAGKTLSELFEKSMADYDSETIDFNKLLTENQTKTTKSAKEHKEHTKKTKEEVKKILTSLEGCDAIIQEATKQMNKLDSKSKDYQKNLEKIKKTILTARVAKLQLLDENTLSGLAESKTLIQQIIKDLPKGSSAIGDWQKKLNDINEKSYNIAVGMSDNGGLAQLKNVQSAIDEIINNLPEGSDEIQKWSKLWEEVNDKIKNVQKDINNLKAGIEKGSVAELQQQIKEWDEQLQNKNLNISARIEIESKKADLQKSIDNITKGELSIPVKVTSTIIQKGSNEDLRQSYDNAQAEINRILDDVNKGVIKSREKAQEEIDAVNDKLKSLKLEPIKVRVQTEFEKDFEEVSEKISAGFSTFSNFEGVVSSMGNLVTSLSEGANAWVIFGNAVKMAENILSTVTSTIELVSKLTEIIGTTTETTAAITTAATAAHAKNSLTEATATQAAATASGEKAVTDTASIGPAAAATAALKLQEAAYLDMAAAAMFAAHAGIPFAGVGIASGQIAAMMAAMTAQHAASAGLAAFAEGGIVGGSSYTGDKILARVNSREMILNTSQQKRLFDILDGKQAFGQTEGVGGQIDFKLRGSDIYGVLHNYSKTKTKTGKISNVI